MGEGGYVMGAWRSGIQYKGCMKRWGKECVKVCGRKCDH